MKAPAGLRSSRVLLLLTLTGLIAAVTFGDTLELKSGQIIQGKFLGGSSMNVRFQVNGQEQIFATKDVLNIGFSEVSDSESAAPPAAQNVTAALSPATALAVPAAPAAAAQTVTIPAGTSLLVRMIDSVDSSGKQGWRPLPCQPGKRACRRRYGCRA